MQFLCPRRRAPLHTNRLNHDPRNNRGVRNVPLALHVCIRSAVRALSARRVPILILDSKQVQVSKTNSDQQQPILELERERVNGSDAHLEIASLETTTKSIVYTYSESCITQSIVYF